MRVPYHLEISILAVTLSESKVQNRQHQKKNDDDVEDDENDNNKKKRQHFKTRRLAARATITSKTGFLTCAFIKQQVNMQK